MGNIDRFGVGPQLFQPVKFTRVFVKDMHNDRPVIQHYPRGFVIALYMMRFNFLESHFIFDLAGKAFHLRVGKAGADDKIIGNNGFVRYMQQLNIRCIFFIQDLNDFDS